MTISIQHHQPGTCDTKPLQRRSIAMVAGRSEGEWSTEREKLWRFLVGVQKKGLLQFVSHHLQKICSLHWQSKIAEGSNCFEAKLHNLDFKQSAHDIHVRCEGTRFYEILKKFH